MRFTIHDTADKSVVYPEEVQGAAAPKPDKIFWNIFKIFDNVFIAAAAADICSSLAT